jgi:hypothetical protein
LIETAISSDCCHHVDMGVLIDYFTAPSDELAAETVDWLGGPAAGAKSRGLFGRARAGYPVVHGGEIDPVVMLGTLEELLTGLTFAEQLSDKSSGKTLAVRNEGERVVVRVRDALVSALAHAPASKLAEVAGPWSQTEEFWGRGDPEQLLEFLGKLQLLSGRTAEAGTGVYSWICV